MLSIIIVSWNTCALLRRCLASLRAAQGQHGLDIIVVDNGSHDGTPAMVRSDFPEVTLIEPGSNLGFSRANNVGMARARGEWLLLLNPDTEIVGDALAEMVSFLEANPPVGLVGPQLLYTDGTRQASRHRFPSPLTLFLASTPLDRIASRALRRYYMGDVQPEKPHPVDWLSGAALLLRRAVYEGVGGLDEAYFMYFEETDWQRRIKAAGWSIWYVPSATIRHHEDASSSQVMALRHIRFNSSRLFYAARWHGARLAALLRLWLLLLFALEWAKEATKGLLGHKRTVRWQRLREYALLLRALWHPTPQASG